MFSINSTGKFGDKGIFPFLCLDVIDILTIHYSLLIFWVAEILLK